MASRPTPLFNHEVRQWIARVNLVASSMPELEVPAFDDPRILETLARAFHGMTLAKEAQAKHLLEAFREMVGKDHKGWIEELTPMSVNLFENRPSKIQYAAPNPADASHAVHPEVQLKLLDCFGLKQHPALCENRVPIRLWLCTPDGKRLDSTTDFLQLTVSSYWLSIRRSTNVRIFSAGELANAKRK